jgi:formylmethanofuran dehydrogenase subunit B
MHSARIFADLDVMRQAGLMFTTPNEARLRADVLLFIGEDLTKIWPAMIARLSPAEIPAFDLVREPRKLLWVVPGRGGAKLEGLAIQTLDSSNLHMTLAALRARAAGRPVSCAKRMLHKLDEFVEVLNNARFGVAVWGGDSLDSLSIEMLHGLIRDLNKTRRFFGLPRGRRAPFRPPPSRRPYRGSGPVHGHGCRLTRKRDGLRNCAVPFSAYSIAGQL